jgi:hypothetical protein
MNILPVITAPLAVQLYRLFFTVCLVYFGSLQWEFRQLHTLRGLLVFGSFPVFSLLGLLATFIRVSWSRWFPAILGIVIPAIVLGGIFFRSSHTAWWDWLLSSLFLLLLLAVPVLWAVMLFCDKRTRAYFTGQAA